MNTSSGSSTSTTMLESFTSDSSVASEFFRKEPCIYTHRMFQRAAQIFASLRHNSDSDHSSPVRRKLVSVKEPASRPVPPMDFTDTTEKKLTYELAFATLKFQGVFEDVLEDSMFFAHHPELQDDSALVMVVLWDFQSRKFQPRVPVGDETLDPAVVQIENAILGMKTKLNATLARRRIKASAPSIEYLLPDIVRAKSSSQKPIPVYAWVNQLKINAAELLEQLKDEGFRQLTYIPEDGELFEGKTFFVDPNCSDTLVFSVDCSLLLQEHDLVTEGFLVRQDKSTCMAAHSVLPLLLENHDVIITNPGTGLVVAHLVSLIHDQEGFIIAVGGASSSTQTTMQDNLDFLGASKAVKIIPQDITELELDDVRLKNARVAVVIADCTKSAINNAVSFIVTEGEDLKILKHITSVEQDSNHLSHLMTKHTNQLRHTLRLPKIQAVVYLTRSVHQEENEVVVEKALEFVNMVQIQKKMPWKVIPPVIPFLGDDITNQKGIIGKYIKFPPSSMTNGCFLVAIAREPQSASDIVARARAKGLISKNSKLRTSQSQSIKLESENDSSKGEESHSSVPPRRNHIKPSKKRNKSQTASLPQATSCPSSAKPSRQRVPPATHLSHASSSKETKDHLPEHLKVVKHPAPFR
ncbi:putative methyltransferase NSUN7 isoform X1 [Pomacea canaliculata]|uniref:putative methyltransferase NSUN7 isoform X1 n=1 Tax=Pomacea canaliculata TaxID=400727 RepID=UPI000D73E62C|nr:putative methyltransferase NSUN7 isoform X1 [Pomacea canaliculata]